MESKEIQEGNHLIAEFINEGDFDYFTDDTHLSWEMYVLEKIANLGFVDEVKINIDPIFGHMVLIIPSKINTFENICYTDDKLRILIWKACVHFLKWYNEKSILDSGKKYKNCCLNK